MRLLYFFIILLILSGCATITERYDSHEMYYQFAFSLKNASRLTFMKNHKNETWIEISSPFLYKTSLIGSVKDLSNDNFEMIIEQIKYFGNWPEGWTEGVSEAYGRLHFIKEEQGWRCKIIDNYELWDVIEGEVRYKEDYYLNENGKQKVKDRIDRMVELVKLLKTFGLPEFYGHYKWRSTYGKPFKDDAQNFLFPETKNYFFLRNNHLLAPTYYNNDTSGDAHSDTQQKNKILLGYGKLWFTEYTEKVFPEYMHESRNTGSLYRDFEEAMQVLYMLYNIDYYYNTVLNDSLFIKNKFRYSF